MTLSTIKDITARRIWDSRGRPTVEVDILLQDGTIGRGIAPAGASRGSREAVDLRDNDGLQQGFNVFKAIANINNSIKPALIGQDCQLQSALDAILIALDPTPTKNSLGGNATIATSFAILNAAANFNKLPLWKYLANGNPVSLPLPEIQIFGGGAHAERRTDIQDFLIMPISARSFDEALEMCANVYHAAGANLKRQNKLAGVADEGGWWPQFSSNEEALDQLVSAIERAGYSPTLEVVISLDIAASEFGKNGCYTLGLDNKKYDRDEWLALLLKWVDHYPILSIEDPFAEDDTEGFCIFTKEVGEKLQIIGDDLLVTNTQFIKHSNLQNTCNAVLIKPNQVGTVTEAHQALMQAKSQAWGTIISARSGETEDITIAHLAVGWNAGQLKVGSFARSERMAKWNECLRIEEQLGNNALFAGKNALPIKLNNE